MLAPVRRRPRSAGPDCGGAQSPWTALGNAPTVGTALCAFGEVLADQPPPAVARAARLLAAWGLRIASIDYDSDGHVSAVGAFPPVAADREPLDDFTPSRAADLIRLAAGNPGLEPRWRALSVFPALSAEVGPVTQLS